MKKFFALILKDMQLSLSGALTLLVAVPVARVVINVVMPGVQEQVFLVSMPLGAFWLITRLHAADNKHGGTLLLRSLGYGTGIIITARYITVSLGFCVLALGHFAAGFLLPLTLSQRLLLVGGVFYFASQALQLLTCFSLPYRQASLITKVLALMTSMITLSHTAINTALGLLISPPPAFQLTAAILAFALALVFSALISAITHRRQANL